MRNKVAAFGEVMMRLQVPNYKKLEQSRTLDYLFSGTGVNILSAVSRYGHGTELLTKLPDNNLGDAALSYIRSLGVGTSHVLRGEEYLGIYFLENGFGVRGTSVTYTNRKDSSFCRARKEEYEYDTLLEGVTLIHFCGISLAVTPNVRETVLMLAREAKKRNITVCFDCNYRPKLWDSYEQAKALYEEMLELADICLMTEKDAIHILGMETAEIEREKQLEDLLPQVAATYNIHTIAGTMRETISTTVQKLTGFIVQDGAIAYSQSHTFDVFDRIGGGDGYTSGIIHGYMMQWPKEKIAEFSIASAILAHTTYGDSPVASLREVEAFMNGAFQELER
ncbi:sugar kinase [Priestia taiwanensis]|uniref:2-dehydro-3-deoxygluconokinase n=1 Tax=Priestia taiwanensis TaxID=1347902 RepID=A0A917AWZ9_9BACI|nr:sugar kinase [Priestia taiwanensis]MBM7364503.1 2-dehydro-3-deoxygluconokinase [Priestia taiwanensis]GGE80986.1 2-dehydro-3-deoxygluconokinase [Priestia taiwanensis]